MKQPPIPPILFPKIETKRLILREIKTSDAEAIFEMRSNSRVNQYIGRKNMESLSESIDLIDQTLKAYIGGKAIPWAILRKGQNKIMGTCGLTSIDKTNMTAEIGGEAAPHFWGKKYAIEAMSAIIKYGFEQVQLKSIIAKFDKENRSVKALMYHLGFQLDKKLPSHFVVNGVPKDLMIYELSPEHFTEYKA